MADLAKIVEDLSSLTVLEAAPSVAPGSSLGLDPLGVDGEPDTFDVAGAWRPRPLRGWVWARTN